MRVREAALWRFSADLPLRKYKGSRAVQFGALAIEKQ